MYKISKTFTFDAAHQLHGLPEGHQCGRLHGHTYKVQVVLMSDDLTDEGWVLDFGEMRWLREYIDTTLDHRNLNDVFDFQPTAELLAKKLFQESVMMLDNVVPRDRRDLIWVEYVRVSETPNNWAEFS
jgi:6-pyruvoyltetrahydropterin/6-carboxytetrahydropterin synthase